MSHYGKTLLMLLCISAISFSPAFGEEDKDQPDREKIRKQVEKEFEQMMAVHELRLQKLEKEVKQLRQTFNQRKNLSNKYIGERVDELVSQSGEDAPIGLTVTEGWTAWRKQDFPTAYKKFKSALARDSDNDIARNGLGWTYVHMQELDLAAKEFRILLKKQPKHGGAMNGLAQCLLGMKKYAEAEEVFLDATKEAIEEMGEESAAKNVACWSGLVSCLIEQDKLKEAKHWNDLRLKYSPEDPNMLAARRKIEKLENQ